MRGIFAAACCGMLAIQAGMAWADTRAEVLGGIARCGGIAEDRQWLQCVYGAVQPMRAQLGLPPAPLAQQKLVPPPVPGAPAPALAAASPPPRPGFFDRLLTHTVEKPEPPSPMTTYSFDGGGLFTVALANGEVWKQSGGDDLHAHWNRPADDYTVVVLPGDGDTHKLKVGHEIFLAERVK